MTQIPNTSNLFRIVASRSRRFSNAPGAKRKTTKYCSAECQKMHWPSHKVLCSAIGSMSRSSDSVRTMFKSHLQPAVHRKLIKLVGRRCEVRCKLNGLETKGLWDTGAMISGVSKNWLTERFPDMEIWDVPARVTGRTVGLEESKPGQDVV